MSAKLCPTCCTDSCPTTATDEAFANDTLVDDYRLDGGGSPVAPGGIPPYPRPGNVGVPSCQTSPFCYDGTPSAVDPRCGPWKLNNSTDTPEGLKSCADTQIDFNCYRDLGTLHTFTLPAPRIGFQAVQANRQWHGVYGNTSEFWNAVSACVWDTGEGDSPSCTCKAERLTPDQTKYLTRNITAFVDQKEQDGTVHSSTLERQVTVGANTGVLTLDVYDDTFDTFCGGSFAGSLSVTDVLTRAQWNLADFITHFLRFIQPGGSTVTRAGNTWTKYEVGGTYDGLPLEVVTCDFAGNFTRDIYQNDNTQSGAPWVVVLHEEATVTNTSAIYLYQSGWDTDPDNTGGSADCTRYQYGFETTLSNENASESILADLLTLRLQWAKDDLKTLPFRTDGFLSTAVLVKRSEVPGDQTPDCRLPDSDVWVDTNDGHFDGSILGAPGKNSQQHFDFDHRTWNHCTIAGSENVWISDYGAYSAADVTGHDATDAVMPLGATRWTENYHATRLRPGRWIAAYTDPVLPGIWLQDWREAGVVRPSQKWARPCGDDAYLMDEDTVRCITLATGDTSSCVFELALGFGGTLLIGVGDSIMVWNQPGLEGIWEVDAIDLVDSTITAHQTAAMPGGLTYDLDQNPCLGKRRYPSASACAAPWDSTASRGDYVRLTYEFNYRDYQERARFVNDDGTDGPDLCTDDSCVAGGDPIRKHQASHGMPREVSTFTATQLSTPATTSCGRILEPDAFPGTFAFDERFGSRWQSVVKQWMPELYWQTPHRTCALINQTDGPDQAPATTYHEAPYLGDYCPADTVPAFSDFYYQQRPWVEAVLTVPSGAPALPAGIYVGYLTLGDLDTAGSVSGNVAPPPGEMGGVVTPDPAEETPWQIHLGECDCIAALGRFKDRYLAQEVSC